ncbi:MAG: FliA/WhiG family RNA polymerase sigma factor [Eubacteriales bacterium]
MNTGTNINRHMNFHKNNDFTVDESVWREYESTKDISLRNRIVESYLYIVTTNIKRMNVFLTNREDIEDITNQGVIELINCVDRYDWRRGIQFDTFSSIRIRGSIIDYIRKKGWVPRDIRKRVKTLGEREHNFQSVNGRSPTDKELAAMLGVDEKEIGKIRSHELGFNVIAFEDLIQTHDISPVHEENPDPSALPEEKLLEGEFKENLVKCVDELEPNEKTVITLYYYEELKLKEIAFVMNLTPSRISQIHAKALGKLKDKITKYISG